MKEISKCCQSKVVYIKDWGNHHDECKKCGKTLEDEDIIKVEPNKVSLNN